jgi:hypothetical protein
MRRPPTPPERPSSSWRIELYSSRPTFTEAAINVVSSGYYRAEQLTKITPVIVLQMLLMKQADNVEARTTST